MTLRNPSQCLNVGLGDRSYDIHIGSGQIAHLGELIRDFAPTKRVAVVTDETVHGLYGAALAGALSEYRTHMIVRPAGESQKSMANLEDVLDSLFRAGFDRSDLLIAFGGGVIGDLAGFAASIYKRGMPFIQVPTTLLSQVDSSVGAIYVSCATKAKIVAEDERESGVRALLNLGHTFGHALELEAGYAGDLLHGEAVSAGMEMAFQFAAKQGLCNSADAQLVTTHLSVTSMPRLADMSHLLGKPEALLRHMGQDKKNEGGHLTLILPRAIGDTYVEPSCVFQFLFLE